MKNNKLKILLVDLETAPLEVYTWGIHEQNVALNQIIKDWSILSFSAKWLDEDKIHYMDTRHKKNPRDDKQLVKKLCYLLNQADYVVSHYGSVFDVPKIEARRLYHDLPLFKMPKHEDTKYMSNKGGFTSHKLEYLAKYLKLKVKKLVNRKFNGMDLWRQVLNKNMEAWREMELYNKTDVWVLEELYKKLRPRATNINVHTYNKPDDLVCVCGSKNFKKNGIDRLASGNYQRYKCGDCGHEPKVTKIPVKKKKLKK